MKNIFSMAILLFSGTSAIANSTWLGNTQIIDQLKDMTFVRAADASTQMNLCYYDRYTLKFEYYQSGVTDGDRSKIWQVVNAVANYVQDDNSSIQKSSPIAVTGQNGNNAVYSLDLNALAPSVVAELPPEMQNHGTLSAHVEILMNGVVMASVPVRYVCAP